MNDFIKFCTTVVKNTYNTVYLFFVEMIYKTIVPITNNHKGNTNHKIADNMSTPSSLSQEVIFQDECKQNVGCIMS